MSDSEEREDKLAAALAEIAAWKGAPDYPNWRLGILSLSVGLFAGLAAGIAVGVMSRWSLGVIVFFIFAALGILLATVAAFRPSR